MKARKLWDGIITLAVLFILVPNLAETAHATGTPDTSWYTANESALTYTIYTADQLAGLAELVNGTAPSPLNHDTFNGRTINLANDINLSAYGAGTGWTPIGNAVANPFQGTFDGGGHTITGLYINDANRDLSGLFGVIEDGAVKNLGVTDVDIIGNFAVGGVAGGVVNARVENSYTTGTVRGSGNSVGGVAGYVEGGSVINSYVAGNVTGIGYVGGVAGSVGFNAIVINSYAAGNVTGDSIIGGVAGGVEGGSVINSYATGPVSGDGIVSNTVIVGGVAGYLNDGSVINSAALNPSVTGTGIRTDVGRVAGQLEGASTLSGNAAWDGMTVSTVLNQTDIGHDRIHGGDIAALEIFSDGTVGGRFLAENGWFVTPGLLPALRGDVVVVPSHFEGFDASLKSLAVSGGILTPAFSPRVLNYTLSVAHDVSVITLTPIANQPGAIVTGGGTVSLRTGDNVFVITVTAPNGAPVIIYTVIRAPASYTALHASATLHPYNAVFDNRNPAGVTVTLNPGHFTLVRIRTGDIILVEGADYSVSGLYARITINEGFLSALPEGEHRFVFEMSGGDHPNLWITVINQPEATEEDTVETTKEDPSGTPAEAAEVTEDAPEETPRVYHPMGPTRPAGTEVMAFASGNTLVIDGEEAVFPAIVVDGYNYLRLRDIAALLNGTAKRFGVAFDENGNRISLTSGGAYQLLGDALPVMKGESFTVFASSQWLFADGREISVSAYNLEGYNYFRLRDIAIIFNFGVAFDDFEGKAALLLDTPYGE